ncbi:MAG: carboxy-S-adenosyl-L-methionine synthase CmoA [Candidatus Omnitrophica bacterium]|nr:carboxy-S-adenosyl-L-methionine synthase CmoA [Candidatus Omnitrophota bacterium]
MAKDTLFKAVKTKKGSFVFDEKTANVFDDMLIRSVPFYSEIQRMIVELTKSFVRNNSNVYDIGCSTGTTLMNLAKNIDKKGIKLIGVDLSNAMLRKARRKLERSGVSDRCVLINADVSQDFEVKDASVVIMNLTLQFIGPEKRYLAVSRIFSGLRRGGCFILVEKILSNDAKFDEEFIEFYHAFKMRNNYIRLEISRKREALENVLIPYKYDENIRLLEKSGFESVDSFFKWYNFCGMIAIKE